VNFGDSIPRHRGHEACCAAFQVLQRRAIGQVLEKERVQATHFAAGAEVGHGAA